MTRFYLCLLLAGVSSLVAQAKCEEVLDLRGDIVVTKDYQGYVDSYTDVKDEDDRKVILEKGKYGISASLDLTKERKTRCEYDVSNLEISGEDSDYSWKATKTYKGRIELDTKKEWTRVHVNAFYPTIVHKLTGESGKKIKRTYSGSPLYLATTVSGTDDTSVIAKGSLAYFNYSDGHEIYGRVKLFLSQD